MKEPRRLLDDVEGIDRIVLESAIDDEPSLERKRKLVIAAASTFALSTTAKSASAAGWKIGIAVASIGAAVGGWRALRREPLQPPVPPTVMTSAPISAFASASPSVSAESSVRMIAAAGQPASATPPSVKPSAPAPRPPPSIALEVALVDEARAAIDSGDGAKALSAIARYDAQCKAGVLAIEIAVLRIEATALSGDDARAESLARAFLAASPDSPHAAKVRRYLPAKKP